MTPRSAGAFSSMSLSSSSSETRPTCARHTWACRVRPSGSGTAITAAEPSASRSELERQAVRVQRGVVLELPAVGGQALREVAGAVEQADADQRDAEVGGGLEVVTGQDAQAAGVLRQHLGDAELGGEVGDARRRLGARATGTSAGSSRYSCRSSTASCSRRTNLRSLARAASRSAETSPSTLTGSPPQLCQSAGSSVSKRSRVSGCHDHRRFITSWDRGIRGSGSAARTVNRRRARTRTRVTSWQAPAR